MADKLCTVKLCGRREQLRRGFCNKHYHQWKSYSIADRRTMRTPNAYKILNGVAHIELYDRKGDVKAYALVDEIDLPNVIQHKWSYSAGYVKTNVGTNGRHQTATISHFIVKPEAGHQIDHINRQPLDNRRENLRSVTPSLNAYNRRTRSNNASGIKGVAFDRYKARWTAYITIHGKQTRLGHYEKKLDAIVARLEAEKALGVII